MKRNRADKWMLLMAIMSDHHLPKDAVVVAAKILDHINCEAGHDYSFASYETIAGECNRSRSTVINAVNDLVKREWFRREKREHKTCLLYACFDRQKERLAPPAEKPKGTRKAAKTTPPAAPVQVTPPPVAANDPGPIGDAVDEVAVLRSLLKHLVYTERELTAKLRSWRREFNSIAHNLPAILLELDDEAGKQYRHRRGAWLRRKLSEACRIASTKAA
jgi:DNA-binding MarR family transcriptional regulator